MNQVRFDESDFVLLNQLTHLTSLDISHNHRISELDLRSLTALEQVNCSYNSTLRLIINGHALKHLNASHNSNVVSLRLAILGSVCGLELKSIESVNAPLTLIQLDISS